MRADLYIAIAQRLKTLTDEDGRPVIKHIDLWNSNIEFLEKEKEFALPAVFIEFKPITWKLRTDKSRDAVIDVVLHVVAGNQAPTEDGSPYQQEGLQFLRLLDVINQTLTGFLGNNFGPFTPLQSITNHNHEEVIESLEVYQVFALDKSAVKVLKTVANPGVVIDTSE